MRGGHSWGRWGEGRTLDRDRPQAPGQRTVPTASTHGALQVGLRSLAWLQTQTSPTGPIRGSAGRGAGPEQGTIHPLFLRPPGACRPRGNGGGGAPVSSLTHRRPLARARWTPGPSPAEGLLGGAGCTQVPGQDSWAPPGGGRSPWLGPGSPWPPPSSPRFTSSSPTRCAPSPTCETAWVTGRATLSRQRAGPGQTLLPSEEAPAPHPYPCSLPHTPAPD